MAKNGYVDIKQVTAPQQNHRLQYLVPVKNGTIQMVDYASVNGWDGKQICTWLPKEDSN